MTDLARNWLMYLWRLTSKICSQQARDTEEPKIESSWSKALRIRKAKGLSSSPNPKAEHHPPCSETIWEKEFFLTQPFILFGPWMNWMRPLHWREQSLLHLLIQMLISSRNTFTGITRIPFDQMPWHPKTQSSWPVKFTTTLATYSEWEYGEFLTTWTKNNIGVKGGKSNGVKN